MGAFQPWHLIVLAIVVVALFGYNKLPDVTRSVGRSLRIFKTEMKGLSEDDKVRDEAQAHGQTTVAPSVAPVPVQTVAVEPVAAATAPVPAAAPSDDEIALAQAVLAAAAKART
ncbi:Sec-independent protein translocase subunit TatA, partial [Jatrophihabitans sp. YIM 134969]